MSSHSFAGLPAAIQQLLQQRSNHVDAMEAIDATLARVDSFLGSPTLAAAPTKTNSKPTARKQKVKLKMNKSGPTASEFVLGFVKEKKNPTSREINAAWKTSGRNRTADMTMSVLTKANQLIWTPLGAGIRGSRYTVPI